MTRRSRICYVCGKPLVRNDLGFYPTVHQLCRSGSRRWCQWYAAHPEKHTECGDLLYAHAVTKRGT